MNSAEAKSVRLRYDLSSVGCGVRRIHPLQVSILAERIQGKGFVLDIFSKPESFLYFFIISEVPVFFEQTSKLPMKVI